MGTNHTPLTPQPVKVLSRNRIRRYTAIAIMTRAQQTVSIGLLVTSLYLSLYLELIPLPSLISEEIIPVVSLANSFTSAIQLGVFQAAGIPVFNIQPLSPSWADHDLCSSTSSNLVFSDIENAIAKFHS